MKKLVFLIILIGIIAVGYYYFLQQRSPSSDFEVVREKVEDMGGDIGLMGRVKTAIALNKNFRAFDIKVTAQEGIVTLEGEVASKAQKELAYEIASQVKDVESVKNLIRVNPEKAERKERRTLGETIDDGKIMASVKSAFSLDRRLEGTHIKVRVYKGVVFLEGTVNNEAQKRVAVRIAKDIDQVSDVKDDIKVVK